MKGAPIRYLVLWLTTGCNLRCVYCYRGEEVAQAMPLATAEKALRLAAVSGMPFHVQLAGGEPTLEPGRIAAIGALVRKAGWPATMAIQTNGTLLDAELIGLCRRYEIAVGVSVDGPPVVQEQLRGMAGATFRGLRLLAAAGRPMRATTVLSAANVRHLGRLILSLASFPNIVGIGLDPLVHKGWARSREVGAASADDIREGMCDMVESLQWINAKRSTPLRWRELDAVSRALSANRGTSPFCHACRGESLAVHPDGSVYPCGQTVGDPAMAVGTVAEVDWTKLHSLYRGVVLQGACESCLLRGRCPGDCPSRLRTNGTVSPQPMCAVYQTLAETLVAKEPSKHNSHGSQ